jgi:hypothetical protein
MYNGYNLLFFAGSVLVVISHDLLFCTGSVPVVFSHDLLFCAGSVPVLVSHDLLFYSVQDLYRWWFHMKCYNGKMFLQEGEIRVFNKI